MPNSAQASACFGPRKARQSALRPVGGADGRNQSPERQASSESVAHAPRNTAKAVAKSGGGAGQGVRRFMVQKEPD